MFHPFFFVCAYYLFDWTLLTIFWLAISLKRCHLLSVSLFVYFTFFFLLMNPLDYASTDASLYTWAPPINPTRSLGSHICLVRPHYARVSSTSAASPHGTVVCAGRIRTHLPTPHAGSCPLDYTTLFTVLHRRQKAKLLRADAHRPVPLLGQSYHVKPVPQQQQSQQLPTSRVTTRLGAASAASQNGEDVVRAARMSTLAHRAAMPEGLTVVERPVPASVAVVMAQVAATTAPTTPTTTPGVVGPLPARVNPPSPHHHHHHHHYHHHGDHRPRPSAETRAPSSQPQTQSPTMPQHHHHHHHHQYVPSRQHQHYFTPQHSAPATALSPPAAAPSLTSPPWQQQHMRYRVGRSGSTQLQPLPTTTNGDATLGVGAAGMVAAAAVEAAAREVVASLRRTASTLTPTSAAAAMHRRSSTSPFSSLPSSVSTSMPREASSSATPQSLALSSIRRSGTRGSASAVLSLGQLARPSRRRSNRSSLRRSASHDRHSGDDHEHENWYDHSYTADAPAASTAVMETPNGLADTRMFLRPPQHALRSERGGSYGSDDVHAAVLLAGSPGTASTLYRSGATAATAVAGTRAETQEGAGSAPAEQQRELQLQLQRALQRQQRLERLMFHDGDDENTLSGYAAENTEEDYTGDGDDDDGSADGTESRLSALMRRHLPCHGGTCRNDDDDDGLGGEDAAEREDEEPLWRASPHTQSLFSHGDQSFAAHSTATAQAPQQEQETHRIPSVHPHEHISLNRFYESPADSADDNDGGGGGLGIRADSVLDVPRGWGGASAGRGRSSTASPSPQPDPSWMRWQRRQQGRGGGENEACTASSDGPYHSVRARHDRRSGSVTTAEGSPVPMPTSNSAAATPTRGVVTGAQHVAASLPATAAATAAALRGPSSMSYTSSSLPPPPPLYPDDARATAASWLSRRRDLQRCGADTQEKSEPRSPTPPSPIRPSPLCRSSMPSAAFTDIVRDMTRSKSESEESVVGTAAAAATASIPCVPSRHALAAFSTSSSSSSSSPSWHHSSSQNGETRRFARSRGPMPTDVEEADDDVADHGEKGCSCESAAMPKSQERCGDERGAPSAHGSPAASASPLLSRRSLSDDRKSGCCAAAIVDPFKASGVAGVFQATASRCAPTATGTITGPPIVFLADMLRLSFSPSRDDNDDTPDATRSAVHNNGDQKLAEDVHCRSFAELSAATPRDLCEQPPQSASRYYFSRIGSCKDRPTAESEPATSQRSGPGTASISSSPPSPNRTAARYAASLLPDEDGEEKDKGDSSLSFAPSPLSSGSHYRHRRRTPVPPFPTAVAFSAEGTPLTPTAVASRLALSMEERRLHASSASTVAWGAMNASTDTSTFSTTAAGAAEQTLLVQPRFSEDSVLSAATSTSTTMTTATATAAAAPAGTCRTSANSTRSSTAAVVFSAPAQTRLQSLLQASTWAATDAAAAAAVSPHHNDGRDKNVTTTEADVCTPRREVDRGSVPLHSSGAAGSSPATRLHDTADSPACYETVRDVCAGGGGGGAMLSEAVKKTSTGAAATCRMPPPPYSSSSPSSLSLSLSGWVAMPPAQSSSSPFRGSGSFLRVQPSWSSGVNAADEGRPSDGLEADIQLLARTTRMTVGTGNTAPPTHVSPSKQSAEHHLHEQDTEQQPRAASPLASPGHFSTNSLSFFLATAAGAAATPTGATCSSATGGGSEEAEQSDVLRNGGSGVYGSAVARRRSWAPRKARRQPRGRQRRLNASTSSARNNGRNSDNVNSFSSRSRDPYHPLRFSTELTSPSPSARPSREGRSSGSASGVFFPPQRLTFGSAVPSIGTHVASATEGPSDSGERWSTAQSTPTTNALTQQPQQQRLWQSHSRQPRPFPPSYCEALSARLSETTLHVHLEESEGEEVNSDNLRSPSLSSMHYPDDVAQQQTQNGSTPSRQRSLSMSGGSNAYRRHRGLAPRRRPRRTSRAASFSLKRSPSVSGTRLTWGTAATSSEARAGALSFSPVHSARRRSLDSKDSINLHSHSTTPLRVPRSRKSGLLTGPSFAVPPPPSFSLSSVGGAQPSSTTAITTVSMPAAPLSLADELRCFSSSVFGPPPPSSPSLASAAAATATTFLASPPPRRSGAQVPPELQALLTRESLPAALCSSTTTTTVTTVDSRGVAGPQLLASAPSPSCGAEGAATEFETPKKAAPTAEVDTSPPSMKTPMKAPDLPLRRGCSERPEVNVEYGAASPSPSRRASP